MKSSLDRHLAGASLLETAEKYIRWVRPRLPKQCEAEIYLSRGEDRGLELHEGRLESLQESNDEGLGLRVLKQGHGGFAYAANLNADHLKDVLRLALAQLSYIPPDQYRAFPSPADCVLPSNNGDTEAPAAGLELEDGSLLQKSLEDQLPRLKEMEERALHKDRLVKKVLQVGYGESRGETVIANTLGVLAAESGTHCSVGMAVIAEKDAQVQIGSGSSSARFYQDLDFHGSSEDAAERAVVLIDSKKLPTRKRSVLFDPWVAGEFVEILAETLSAEAVQRGRSLFAGKLGKRVASPLVHLVDDPHRQRGVASSRFDDEGIPTRRKTLIEAGMLKDYFYDLYTANKDRRKSNGCAGRASYRGVPGPSCSNFYIGPGPISRDQLIADTQDGVLVFEVMGMHMTDPVSGEFSVGISGIAVEKGQLTHGVRGAMLSGNILELLAQIDAVADDLTFYGRLAAPTFRVRDLMVA